MMLTGLDHLMDDGKPGQPCYRCGDLEVDTRRHRVLRGGVELALEPKAYGVLLELLHRRGGVVARDALLDAVWGHRHVTPAVLNRIIALLRRELGDEADHPHLIRTVHGIGYEFIGAPVSEPCDGNPLPTVAAAPVATERMPTATVVEEGAAPSASPAALPSRGHSVLSRTTRHFMLALLLLASALLVLLAWPPSPRSQSGTPADAMPAPVPARSVAVLPLVDAAGDAQQQFFADGLSENLITTLSQYDSLKVIGRGSSFLFRDSKEDAAAIGAKLGVAHLVEGSVQRDGDDVRVSIELIRAADGRAVWTRRFDRPYKDLFELQDDITLAVAGALQVKLLHAMPSMVEAGRPVSGNLDAYEAYLRASALMSGGDLREAIEQFVQATRIDPAYAQAWSWLGLARTLYALRNPDREAARAGYAQAREAVDTALRLQPDFGQAHAIHANWLSVAKRDWNGALAEFRIALSLVPDNDPSHGATSLLLATLGEVDKAIAERRKYIAGDPLNAPARIYLAELLASRGRLDEAAASLRDADALNTNPTSTTGDWRISQSAYIAILAGDATNALAEADTMKPGLWRERWRALALQIGADHAAADASLQRLVETDGRAKGDAYTIARVYALRGDPDHVFEWLQRDMDRGDSAVHNVLLDSLLLRFRDDPRFAAWCKRAGLPSPQASDALGLDAIRAAFAKKRCRSSCALDSDHRVRRGARKCTSRTGRSSERRPRHHRFARERARVRRRCPADADRIASAGDPRELERHRRSRPAWWLRHRLRGSARRARSRIPGVRARRRRALRHALRRTRPASRAAAGARCVRRECALPRRCRIVGFAWRLRCDRARRCMGAAARLRGRIHRQGRGHRLFRFRFRYRCRARWHPRRTRRGTARIRAAVRRRRARRRDQTRTFGRQPGSRLGSSRIAGRALRPRDARSCISVTCAVHAGEHARDRDRRVERCRRGAAGRWHR
jgi:TolB-like protein/DNA-binding winged helix-turn-helix (wHTH) protein/thioredoxin-like negative regulator of GroEL